MSLADVTSARSSPTPDACPECDTSASVTSDLHKYQVACTCKPSAQYACADDPGPPPPAKTDTPPALPPRPPTSVLATNRRNNAAVGCPTNENNCRRRKYAWWCVGCGALAAALGGLLAAQHILLRTYTASPHHLETVPAAVPAAMLVLTGVCIMSLARRRNRYSYMIKVVGACCLVCALTCVLVTITTTVIHMNKLQTLKFCEYTKLTRTCTCFSLPPDMQHTTNDDDGVRCVFEGVTDCAVVHGALYWCLRGVFALSVSAVLLCIFSCMLAYQLLSHERKKMYWEQLELRCRSLYRPPVGQTATTRPVQSNCSCCTQCHPAPTPAWDISLQHRFWAPGRIGNLYSPNPGTGRKTSAWSWFPWPRASQNSRHRMPGVPQSGDSAYGFCDGSQPAQNYEERPYPAYQYAGEGGSYDARTGQWGPPPPYSPQGRSGSRHHLHQDPAAATLLHHHHIDVHRNSMNLQNIQNIQDHTNLSMQPHTCRNSYMMHSLEINRLNPEIARINTDIAHMNTDINRNPESNRINAEINRINPDMNRINAEMNRINPEMNRINPEMNRINAEMNCMNPDLSRIQELARINPDLGRLAQMYPQDVSELMRLQSEMAHLPEGRFNTLRGHLVPYNRACQRSLGMSAGNLHRDCRLEDNTVECSHQKSVSKVSDQSTDSSLKQGKENLGFQNDKHSPMRASMQECHRGVNQNAESEVYFADVSSCCNVSVKADCCANQTVSALVGTIENHPESTSESDTGSFTLTRQQRPQPQVGSKRRPQKHSKDKPRPEESCRNERIGSRDRLDCRMECRHDDRFGDRMNEVRMSERLNESQRMNDSRVGDVQRLNDSRLSERMNDCRLSERMNDSRLSERLSESQRMNDSRLSERLNESQRMNETRLSDKLNELHRMNDARLSERLNESQRLNDSRISERINEMQRMNESRISERLNESQRMNDTRLSDRINDSRSSDRMNDSRLSERMIESQRSGFEDRRVSDLNSSTRNPGSPKSRKHLSPLRLKSSPIPNHPRQSSSDSGKPEFFPPPPPNISPLSPNTEESLLSDEDQVYSNDPESSKCLGPDAQYEVAKEEKELKVNHHHCYSDTNTMDSGWQSGSEKQVTD